MATIVDNTKMSSLRLRQMDNYISVEADDGSDLIDVVNDYAGERPIFVPEGDYTIDEDVEIAVDNLVLQGGGWNSVLKVNAGCGFSFAHTENLLKASFRNLNFDGQSGTADFAIRSTGMASGKRLTGLRILDCYFDGFYKAASYCLDLTNLEMSYIQRNEIMDGRAGLIRLDSDNYGAGNIWITDNLILMSADYAGCVGILAEPSDATNHTSVGSVWIVNNQFLGGVVLTTGVKLVSTEADLSQYHIINSRYEACQLYEGDGNSSYDIENVEIAGSKGIISIANHSIITLDAYCFNHNIHDNILNSNVGTGKQINEAGVNTTSYNKIHDNILRGAGTPTISSTSYCTNNQGYNALDRVTANFRASTNMLSPYGSASNVAASTDYYMRHSDCLLTCSGGTGVDVVIKDKAGNQVGNPGATCDRVYVPHLYRVNWGAFSVMPTAFQFEWL